MAYEPAYERIAREYRDKITGGELKVGDKLPSITQLKALYGVSETVVRNAMLILRTEKLVEGKPGSGVFVIESTE